jgi:hypothetical protein
VRTPGRHPSAPSNAIVDALCSAGPLLDSFDIDLSSVRSTSAGRSALAFLGHIAGKPDDTSSLSGELVDLANAVREELDELDTDGLAQWLGELEVPPSRGDAAERFWRVFAPESAGLLNSWDEQVARVRRQRLVTVDPIDRGLPTERHILFTSNVLLTSPDAVDEQLWHFDHPMVIGADAASNEIVHGLRGLNAAIAFEKERGTIDASAVVDCVLSVSVTHESLMPVARQEVRRSIDAAGELENLAVFAFTEVDTQRLVAEVLAPAIGCDPSLIEVFGVNGNYGRHYSFGKAIAALWQTVMDGRVDRTFKIDLDQVFPQKQLDAETGMSALELLETVSAWSANGIDSDGALVELGMCAGALVNESDLQRGLFTADIDRPTAQPCLADLMFRKSVTQALSTEAEMMDRGDNPPGSVRQRIHVTGGVTGITVDALTRHRPFTPSFLSRAEDQAYLLSVMDGRQPGLRIAHIPGLFMRHDKESVAQRAMRSAEIGTAIGDYERTILFTGYARALGLTETTQLDPFTGSYISQAPLSVTLIRLMLEVIDRVHEGDEATGSALLIQGVRRVTEAFDLALAPDNRLSEIVTTERAGWDRYYDAVASLEQAPALARTAAEIIGTTRLAYEQRVETPRRHG